MTNALFLMRALLLFWLSVVVAAGAQAQQAAPTVVLFVGNSFTYGGSTKVHSYNAATVTDEPPGEQRVGGIPAIFKKFADEAGLRYEVHVETVGGKDLAFHYQSALALVAQGKWDAVVLQGYSTEPLPAVRGGKPESFLHFATLLENVIHKARPETKIYLYETWAYPLKTYPENPSDPLASRRAMSGDLQTGYESAFSTVGHFEAVAPVGDAYLKLTAGQVAQSRETPAAVDLLDNDHKHPSVSGSYLSALVLFQTITGCNATRLGPDERAARDLGIPREEVLALQGTADETVRTVHYTTQGVQTIGAGQTQAVRP